MILFSYIYIYIYSYKLLKKCANPNLLEDCSSITSPWRSIPVLTVYDSPLAHWIKAWKPLRSVSPPRSICEHLLFLTEIMDIISFSHYTKNTLRLFHYFTQTNSKTTSFSKYFDMLYLHNLHSNIYMHPTYRLHSLQTCLFFSVLGSKTSREIGN